MENKLEKLIDPKISNLDKVKSLETYGFSVAPDLLNSENAFRISLNSKEGNYLITIRILFNDPSGSDVVITNMTTLPEEQKGKGYGSMAIQNLLKWARENNFKEIRATQIQEQNEHFWAKNGFVKENGQYTNTNDFILKY